MIGQTLGAYEIVEEIGVGGMAAIYKAYDPGTDRHVAIKVLPDHYSSNPVFRERFHREAKAIARLEHVHILPIFGYGEEKGRAYLVMRYMPTGTLSQYLSQGKLPLAEVSRLLAQMASALDAAHEMDILHRDVKPSNILLDKHHNVFLSDFGLAKILEDDIGLTGSGILGTPAYMSPEQCSGEKNLTRASDQYALGVILYQMVTGVCPYAGGTPIAIIMQHVNAPLPDARIQRPDLPSAAARVIARALAKKPGQRFRSCSEMAEAFANALSPEHAAAPIAAPAVPPILPAPPTVAIIPPAAPTVASPTPAPEAPDDYNTIGVPIQGIKCAACGASFFDHDMEGNLICAQCGTLYAAPVKGILCTACGTENPPTALRCMNCGLSLGRLCPVCGHSNPPNTDHCLQCATPLDRLSTVLMRSGMGKKHVDKHMNAVLVKTKGQDAIYMQEQRRKLDEEERERIRVFQAQRAEAMRQQRLIMTISVTGISLLVIIAVVLFVITR